LAIRDGKLETRFEEGDLAKLVQDFQETFCLQNVQETAVTQLTTLQQGSTPWVEFAANVQTLVARSRLKDDASIIAFIKLAIDAPLRQKMAGVLDQPTKWKEWLRMVGRIQTMWEDDKKFSQPRENDHFQRKPHQSTSHRAIVIRNDDQMKREGRCFNCREKGHLARNCPKPQNIPYPREQRQSYQTENCQVKIVEEEETIQARQVTLDDQLDFQ
jgi:hypothetical protein